MNQIFVRPYRPTDLEKLVGWEKANPAWDSKVLSYQTSFVLAAFNSTGTLGFLPVQRAMVMEAMAFHPLTTDSQKALIMKELTHELIFQTANLGSGEIYFLSSNQGTGEFAERQGFKKLEEPMYRVRIADLERGGNGNGSAT